jgi:hypothetical protein
VRDKEVAEAVSGQLTKAGKRLNWKARSDELIKAYDMSIK